MTARDIMRRMTPPGIVLGVIIAGWYGLAYSLNNNFASADGSALIIPPPHMLFDGFNAATRGRIFDAALVSASTALVGLAVTAVTGGLIGLLMARSRAMESAIWPWLITLQVTPIIVLTPIIVRIVGPSFGARVLVTVLIAFFPVASNTLYGLRAIPSALHDLFTLAGVRGWRRLIQLHVPATAPAFLAGLRVSAGLAVIGSIVGDFFFTRGTPGLGRLVTQYFQETRSGPMFVTALVAALIGLAFFLAVAAMRRILISPWDRP